MPALLAMRSCRDGHSAKVSLCFLKARFCSFCCSPCSWCELFSLVAHAATGSSFLLTKKGTKDVPRGSSPSWNSPCCRGAMPTCWHCAHVRSTSQVASYAARRGCVASHRIATLPCSTPQSAGGSVPFIVCGSVRSSMNYRHESPIDGRESRSIRPSDSADRADQS